MLSNLQAAYYLILCNVGAHLHLEIINLVRYGTDLGALEARMKPAHLCLQAAWCRTQDAEGSLALNWGRPAWGNGVSWQMDRGDIDPESGRNQVCKLVMLARQSVGRWFSLLNRGSTMRF